jgi:hypothetical protein
MTRRKDIIKKKQEIFSKRNSRIGKKKIEIEKEIDILKNIQKLPDELIRIIYTYLTGRAKLLVNYDKYDFIKTKLQYYGCIPILNIIISLSKKEIISLINNGFLRNYTNIINSIIHYYECLDTGEFEKVSGKRLFNLWEKNMIFNNYEIFSNQEDQKLYLDTNIILLLKYSIYDYIKDMFKEYTYLNNINNINNKNIIYIKNIDYKYNILCENINKIFYLYKCFEFLGKKLNK